jgi:hypothetical protein
MRTVTINQIVQSEILKIPELKALIGKKVQIKIKPILDEKANNSKSKLGSYDLGGKFDNINVRDFAYED